MDRLNIFNPYTRKNLWHEDVLTRNFLILVNNVPSVQIAFFEMIRGKLKTMELESIAQGKLSVSEVRTQVNSGNYLRDKREHNIVSVIISDDEFEKEHEVRESSRDGRYDGVIICDPSWIFIIENKPSATNIWEEQTNIPEEDVEGNNLVQELCRLSWREVIELLRLIIQNDIASKLEKIIIDDFLEYVNDNYDWLNPYNEFGLCKENKWLLDKRCDDILKKCFKDKEINRHPGWKNYVDTSSEDAAVHQLALDYDSNSRKIILWMYVGEKIDSARFFYKNVDIELAQEISKDSRYLFVPNFHFAYRGTPLVWFSTTKMDVFQYMQFWKNENLKQIKKDEFEEYYCKLVEYKVIDANDETVRNKITLKNYPDFNLRPGVLLGYEWPIEEAIKLDNEGRFAEDCMDKIRTIRSVYLK